MNISYILLTLTLALPLLPGCLPTSQPAAKPTPADTTAAADPHTIGPLGGSAEFTLPAGNSAASIRLIVPPGALAKATKLTVTAPDLPAQALGLQPVLELQFGPAGALAAPIEVQLQFDANRLAEQGIIDISGLVALVPAGDGTTLPMAVTSTVAAPDGVWTTLKTYLPAFGAMKVFGPHVDPKPDTWKGPYKSAHPPVLLVHGWQAIEDVTDYLQIFTKAPNGGTWGELSPMPGHKNLLANEADPAEVFELHYYTGFTIHNGAGSLAKTLAAIRKATGQKTVTVVAHSMGGLVARTYTHSAAYANDIERLITLGTPHGGTNDGIKAAVALFLANPLYKLAAEAVASSLEMAPGSTFLNALNAKPPIDLPGPAPDYHVLMGAKDLLVVPKYAPLAQAVGLQGKPHANVIEYCYLDKHHTSIGSSANSGIADIDSDQHPAYTPVCRAIGLTSPCGGKANFDAALCNCKPLGQCTVTETAYVCHGPLSAKPIPELCDLADNDCNGQTDDVPAAVLQSDPANCGQCGKACLNSQTCTKGKCSIPAFGDPTDKQTTKVNVTVTQVEQSTGGKVKVYASVQTQSGDPIEQLTIGNFGVAETVAGVSLSTPVDSLEIAEESSNGLRASLVIDSSGSMYTEPPPSLLDLAKAAAKEFVSYLKPGDEVAIVDFSGNVIVQQGLTNNKFKLFTAIDACNQAGGTAMFDGAQKGVDLLTGTSGQRAVLLLTDGADTASNCGTSSQCIASVVSAAKANSTPIYAIGLGLTAGSSGETDLLALAQGSNAGGMGIGYYIAPNGGQLKALYEKLATILKKTYLVGWFTSAKPGQTVNAKVTVTYAAAGGSYSDSFDVAFLVQ